MSKFKAMFSLFASCIALLLCFYGEVRIRSHNLNRGKELIVGTTSTGEKKADFAPELEGKTSEQQILSLYQEYAHLFPLKDTNIMVKNFGKFVIVYIEGYHKEDVQPITPLARSLASIVSPVKPETESWYMEKTFTMIGESQEVKRISLRYMADRSEK